MHLTSAMKELWGKTIPMKWLSVRLRECKNPRPWKRDETILRHGLLRCKTCERLWNRDVNGSLNIHKVVVDMISKIGRPAYLSRISAAASAAHNQVSDEDAKPQL